MTEAEWPIAVDVELLLDHLPASASRRKLRLFAVACCRRVWRKMTQEATRRAVEHAELFADGRLSKGEMEATRKTALRFVRDSGSTPAEYMGTAVARANFIPKWVAELARSTSRRTHDSERAAQADLLRDIFGNPFRPVIFSPSWRTDTAVTLARTMYDSRNFSAMPILADALQDAGCDSDDNTLPPRGGNLLNHCRDPKQVHVRGCWVVDLVLGKK